MIKKLQNIETYFKEFRDAVDNIPIVSIAVNKSDLSTENIPSLEEWVAQRDITVVETSVKTGEGIQELFGYLAFSLKISGTSQSSQKPQRKVTESTQIVPSSRCLYI
jgi:50S ribosomal subunit-associated GTPase HflX